MYKNQKQYRLPGYDYTQSGNYFITIVCKNREHFLGEIVNGFMVLSPAGIVAKENILKFLADPSLANPYQNNPYFINQTPYLIAINEFTIMPNHVHLIVEIVRTRLEACSYEACSYEACSYEACSYNPHNPNLHPLLVGSVGSFINHFKGKIKRWCNENNIPDFAWQARFHDRIIRDWGEYNRIVIYIKTNVENWNDDKEFLPGL
jgi:putative transposase